MIEPEKLRAFLEEKLPRSVVTVSDMTGGMDHFEIEVVSQSFEGMSVLERHRKLHEILEPLMEEAVHAVQLKAYTPSQKSV